MSRIWKRLLSKIYLANYRTSHVSYRVGIGIFAAYQGLTRIIFDTVALPVGVLPSYLYGIIEAIAGILVVTTAYKYRFTKIGHMAVAALIAVYLMLGISILLKGAIISGGGAIILAIMLIFFELFASEEY